MARTEKTEKKYIEIAQRLIRQYEDATSMHWGADKAALCLYFEKKRATWRPATWRLFRSSLVFFLEKGGKADWAARMNRIDEQACAGAQKNTSTKKAKSLHQNDLESILNFLDKKHWAGHYSKLLGLWLTVGRITGLRPSEWNSAHLLQDALVLTVRNAKHTNNRSFGSHRTLLLHDMPENYREIIRIFFTELHHQVDRAGSFEKVFNGVRRQLKRICQELWPDREKHPSLYSARHQFAADLKAAGVPREEISAMFGHRVTSTVQRHYARKFTGEKGGGQAFPCASQEDVMRIQEFSKEKPRHR